MRYKEYIHTFLQRSLMIYMRYNDEIKKAINQSYVLEDHNNLDDIKEEDSEPHSDESSRKDVGVQGNHEINENCKEKFSKENYKCMSSTHLPNFNIYKHPIKQLSAHHLPRVSHFHEQREFEVDKHIDRIKNELYFKFSGKIEKILSFFKEKGITFDNIPEEENPLYLLKLLKSIKEVSDRNEIIEKLEISVSKLV
jgi:hypothetical protein